MLKNKRNLVLAGMVAITMCLSACGNRMPANAPVDDSSSSGAASTTPAAAPSAAPVAATPAAPAPIAGPAAAAYTQPTGSLVVSNVNKTKKGIFFKTLTVAGSVVNNSNVPLSGTLKVEFKKNKGIFTKTVETTATKTLAVTTLQPGQSFPFTVTADQHGDDDADCTVDTNPVAAAPAAAAPAAAMMAAPAYGTYGAPATGSPY